MLRSTIRKIVVLAALLAGLIATPAIIRAAGLVQGPPSAVYLPAVFKAGSLPGATTGLLADGGTFSGLDGLTIGAITGTLTQTVEVTVAGISAPLEALPAGTQLLSTYYSASSAADVVAPVDQPFIFGIPVPSGALTHTLALAIRVPTDEFRDADAPSSHEWVLAPGVYDAAAEMFLTTLPALPVSGSELALIQHPGMPSTLGAAGRGAGGTPNFLVVCIGFASPADCGPAQTDAIKAAADQALVDYNDALFGMGFKLPKLLGRSGDISLSPPQLKQPFDTYYVYLYKAGTHGCTATTLGYYSPSTGLLVVCLAPGAPITDKEVSTFRHEYFHAVQYAYDSIYDPLWVGTAIPEKFIIEGTATAAEESLFVMKRASVLPFSLHPVDVPITAESSTQAILQADEHYEYKAQDFWVFLGEQNGWWLEYLIGLFERGAQVKDVVDEFGNGEYLEPYWDWAKNQAMEASVDFEGALGSPCELEAQLVLEPELFEYIWDSHVSHPVTVGPLDTLIVEVIFDLQYDGAQGGVGPTNSMQDPEATPSLRYKMYEEGESGCESLPDGGRTYFGVEPEPKRYYVVISNIDYDSSHDYTVSFETWPAPLP